MDYDDLVVEANKFLLNPENEYLKKNYQSKYKQILIDEFQDNNFAQFSILKNIANDGNVTAVGDDDQNIYRFQGAYAQIFDDFRITFPNHTEIILSRNYRNPPHVINFSGQLLEQDKYRKPKPITAEKNDTNKVEVIECNSELSQAEYVKKYIQDSMKKNPSYKFKDFAILSRKQKDGLRTAQLLVSEGIPVNYKGKTSINSSVSSKVIFSFLRVIADPMNSITSIVRILQEYGITEQNISKINFEAKKRSRGKPDGDYVFDVLSDLQVPNITQTNELKEIFKMINEFINLAKNSTISETVYQIARNKTSIYKKIANDDSIENFIERSTIDNIINTTSDFEKIFPNGTMKDFLDFIDELDDLDIETKTNSVDLDAVNVSTIHGSKGLEFKVVFIVDVAPFKIPLRFTEKPFYVPTELVKGQRPPAEPKVEFEREERRVFYVGMTRAIDRLIISYPTKYENRETSNRASRFLLELKPQKNAQVDFQNFNFSRAIQKYVGFNAVDILKNEIIQEAKNHIDSSNFSSAIQKIIDLANISHFVNNKTSSGFEIDPLVPKTVSPEIQTKLQGKYEKLGFTGVNLSFTKIDQYHDCPKKFWYENVISALPNSPQSQLYKGSIFHEIVEESAQRKAQGVQDDLSKLKSELVTKWSNTAYLALPIKKEEEDKKSLEPALESYIKWANSNSNEIVEVEHEFNIDVAGFPVKGKIDRIEKTKNGDYIIIDYKTGGKNKRVDDPATSLQLNIYCLAVKKRFGVLPKQAIFFYVEKPDGEQFFVYDVDEAKVNSALTELETYVKDIMDKKFDAKPSYQICKWCSFNDICDDANKKEQKN